MMETSGAEEFLSNRLPVDYREIRVVAGRYFLHIGRIARLLNLRPEMARSVMMDAHNVERAAWETSQSYIAKKRITLPGPMALQPLLACEEEGRIFLLDGLQRANIAFVRGAISVRVLVIPITLALAIGAEKVSKTSFRLFEATKKQPVGLDPTRPHTTSVIQVHSRDDLRREGQTLEPIEAHLRALLIYQTLCAVERQSALRRTNRPKIIEQQILDEWHHKYALPPSPSWKECANGAKKVIAEVGGHSGKRALRLAIKTECLQVGGISAHQMLAQEIYFRNILLKAFHRSKDQRSFGVAANKIEYAKCSDETAIKNAQLAFATAPINGNRRRKATLTKKEAQAFLNAPGRPCDPPISIDLREQIILAKYFGLNPNLFCNEFSYLDSIFEAYVFAHNYKIDPSSLPTSAAMIETFMQQRALAELTKRNGEVSQDHWYHLFAYYEDIGMKDVISREMLLDLDRQWIIDDLEIIPISIL